MSGSLPPFRKVLVLLVLATGLVAQPGLAAAPAAPRVDTPLVEIIVLRHGVRAPTAELDKQNEYSLQPWPAWPVAPGMLTPHGHAGMKGIGSVHRQRLLGAGMLATACPTGDALRVIADTTPRNRESAAALLEGLAPGCALSFLAMPGDAANPLFHYSKIPDDDPPASATGQASAALSTLQWILLGCTDHACIAAADTAGKKVLLKDGQAKKKAGKHASGLAENLMLAYAQGMPPADVGWGRADAQRLDQVITLHNETFDRDRKSMPAAAIAGSNLAAHILATLQVAAGEPAEVAPLAANGRGVVVLVGHDTTLAALAGVFGLDWSDAAHADELPPGGAVVFDLVRSGSTHAVHVSALMPTMAQLRANRFDGMKAMPVKVHGCRAAGPCVLADFSKAALQAIDGNYVQKALPSMTAQPLPTATR